MSEILSDRFYLKRAERVKQVIDLLDKQAALEEEVVDVPVMYIPIHDKDSKSAKAIVTCSIKSKDDDYVIDFYSYNPENKQQDIDSTDGTVIVAQLLNNINESSNIPNIYRDNVTGLLTLDLTENNAQRIWYKIKQKKI